MKLFLSITFFLNGMAAAHQPMADLRKQSGNGGIDFMMSTDDVHRRLMGGEGCNEADDFVCPANSDRIRGRSCYTSFDDCECQLGYSKQGDSCVAQEGLCSVEYADLVVAKAEEVERWVALAYATSDEEERYGYYQQMDIVLSEAWKDYNMGKASCEMFVFDGDITDFDDADDGRMLLRETRELFFRAIGRAFKKAAQFVVKAAKAVVNVVVETVELVVEVVTEIVECGVGIVKDGAKCGLIGCAFGLVGVALDIAFTVATGGLNKATEAACSLDEAFSENGEGDDTDTGKKRKGEVLGTLLGGVGSSVCAINEKLESNVLEAVCDVNEKIEEVDNGLAFVELIVQDAIVFRFLETFRLAMCGNPGSAVLDLLEEVVACSTGCADENNVFCPAIEENKDDKKDEPEREPESEPEPEPESEPEQEPEPVERSVEYEKVKGKACRTSSGGKGDKGTDFKLFQDKSEDECLELCSESSDCKGWEFSTSRCEIWKTQPAGFVTKSGFDCFVKILA